MFPWFISNTLAAAGLALVVFLMCRFGRFRPAVQHALWLVVLVKLLTPAWLAWPWSPWDLFDHPVAVETASPPMDELVVDAATPAPTPAEARLTLPTPSETVPPHEPKLATASRRTPVMACGPLSRPTRASKLPMPANSFESLHRPSPGCRCSHAGSGRRRTGSPWRPCTYGPWELPSCCWFKRLRPFAFAD